jgi:hypothetical protein
LELKLLAFPCQMLPMNRTRQLIGSEEVPGSSKTRRHFEVEIWLAMLLEVMAYESCLRNEDVQRTF